MGNTSATPPPDPLKPLEILEPELQILKPFNT